jgi:hypothetical protein
MSASNYYFNSQPHHAAANGSSSSHHTGRGRRAPRLSQNPHNKQLRSARKEEEVVAITKYRQHFEEGRSFDLQDDLDFCPFFVSDDDYPSTSGSDRSSISSGASPQASPQSHQVTPEPFSLNSNSNPYVPSYQSQPTSLKLHQPAATRIRNAIPIVNPSTGVRMSSPPSSVSPARMQQQLRRW